MRRHHRHRSSFFIPIGGFFQRHSTAGFLLVIVTDFFHLGSSGRIFSGGSPTCYHTYPSADMFRVAEEMGRWPPVIHTEHDFDAVLTKDGAIRYARIQPESQAALTETVHR